MSEKHDTNIQFKEIISQCRNMYVAKMKDYGPAWRILRPQSITDQIFIKVKRIRTLQTVGESLVGEGVEPEFIGIVNYAAMGIIQLRLGVVDNPDLNREEATKMFDDVTNEAYELMTRKNHDYGEAWRDMRVQSYTDMILSKLERIKSIEDNNGKTLYWNPDVIIVGEAGHESFYRFEVTIPPGAQYEIVVEGITSTGRTIHLRQPLQ